MLPFSSFASFFQNHPLLHATLVHLYLVMLAEMLLQRSSTILCLASQILVAVVTVGQTAAVTESHVDSMYIFQMLCDFGIRSQMGVAVVAVCHGGYVGGYVVLYGSKLA